ncbi:MAG: chromosome segregation protein SMC [Lachnospiraceae bacterium]|nr:chromosome segregation protein SMC [Lachnospiraceae bacterium]
MYLKSIEMQGFKSFANKIVLDFHTGITGIVGPNGSGKSNVSDAVRWVLGEQSAKQLRSENMQDVIFSGTENRRPLGYAYVSITLDNSDHVLPVDFQEVTVSRRVYRSGESEYLINGAPCRLREVNELFYDTGIGKEGYSIIGQGQIERILSGKPEERRELFDEAVGIVKYKKRKAASEKRLEHERENLVRVNDILSELEGRVGPLEKQSETAKRYLTLKENLKKLDVNMYLMEMDRIEKETDSVSTNANNVQKDLSDSNEELNQIRKNYAELEEKLSHIDERIEKIHQEETETSDKKNQLENQITLLEEQIHSAENSDESLNDRKKNLLTEHEEKLVQKEETEAELKTLSESLSRVRERLTEADVAYKELSLAIKECNETIEKDHQKIVALLNEKAEIQSELQKFTTIREQTNIRKAEIVQKLLSRKTQDAKADEELQAAQEEYLSLDDSYKKYQEDSDKYKASLGEARDRKKVTEERYQKAKNASHVLLTKKETLQNLLERYEGYGNSIRRVMDQKKDHPGIIGVVSDLIHVEKRYETAIETALGGNIQNIVTEDETTAKAMIDFLKRSHAGRATFLPLTSVHPKENQVPEHVLDEKGVLGLASDLVDTDDRYRDIMKYLLGRVVVMETLDSALAFAKKTHYQNHVVTLEGEYLRPGGSLTGGAFKNSNNLLGRNRELEQLEEDLSKNEGELRELQEKLDAISQEIQELQNQFEENRKSLEETALKRNTAMIALSHAKENVNQAKTRYDELNAESTKIEEELKKIDEEQTRVQARVFASDDTEKELQEEIHKLQEVLLTKTKEETAASQSVSGIQLEEANASQKVSFMQENLNRIVLELQKNEESYASLEEESLSTRTSAEQKKSLIEKLKTEIASLKKQYDSLEEERRNSILKKEEINQEYKGFFDRREEVSDRINRLDKELYRLNGKRQKLEEELEYQNNYMWDEYELTLHAAMELKDPEMDDHAGMKREISKVKDEIRSMGSVNVNAIEEYKEVFERYSFLKNQHDDLVEAEQSLVTIIQELDEGMRKQFASGFKSIQVEFDKAFKALFGGGKGSLELVEGEDLLETGIRIIAQPPGKKLQNMMQMSGGEKSLTAIALLFAIQNLKPSPFCLLDEIEAALDDSNVDRFAKYLHKLTKNTQFIVITHRRGTMTAADRLYGITMQEKGVSTLVSVNLIDQELTD